MINTYQNQLEEYLQLSMLTPAVYAPSNNLKNSDHVAVCVAGNPVLLTGPTGDQESIQQANAFCESKAFATAMRALCISGMVTSEVVSGDSIQWLEKCEAVTKSVSGVIEAGNEDGDLMTINLSQNRGLTTLLCVSSELARIIDSNAPSMCNGMILPKLAVQTNSPYGLL